MRTALLADLAQWTWNLHLLMTNRPNTAAMNCWAIVDNDFNKFHCTLRLLERSNIEPRPHQDNRTHAWCRDYSRAGFILCQLKPNNWCRNNSRAGRIQGNTVCSIQQSSQDPYTWKFSLGENFCTYSHGQVLYPANLLSRVDDYIEPMAIVK